MSTEHCAVWKQCAKSKRPWVICFQNKGSYGGSSMRKLAMHCARSRNRSSNTLHVTRWREESGGKSGHLMIDREAMIRGNAIHQLRGYTIAARSVL